MKDDKDMPALFLRHLSVIFPRATRLWFEMLRNEYPKPFYIAIPIIQEKDPVYSKHLEILTSNKVSNEEKIETAELIYKRLFEGAKK